MVNIISNVAYTKFYKRRNYMKKIIFGLIAFGVVCFATTGVLIYSHNQKIVQEEKHDIIEKR